MANLELVAPWAQTQSYMAALLGLRQISYADQRTVLPPLYAALEAINQGNEPTTLTDELLGKLAKPPFELAEFSIADSKLMLSSQLVDGYRSLHNCYRWLVGALASDGPLYLQGGHLLSSLQRVVAKAYSDDRPVGVLGEWHTSGIRLPQAFHKALDARWARAIVTPAPGFVPSSYLILTSALATTIVGSTISLKWPFRAQSA